MVAIKKTKKGYAVYNGVKRISEHTVNHGVALNNAWEYVNNQRQLFGHEHEIIDKTFLPDRIGMTFGYGNSRGINSLMDINTVEQGRSIHYSDIVKHKDVDYGVIYFHNHYGDNIVKWTAQIFGGLQ